MLLSDLEELPDILETLVFEDEPSIFTEQYAVELVETSLHLMDECLEQNPQICFEQNFHKILFEEIKEILYVQFEDQIDTLNGENVENDLDELIEESLNIYISTFYPEKIIYFKNNDEIEEIEKKIQLLREIHQPTQRTPEWYSFRWNLITASNAWKAFKSQSTINQLIFEKCQPLQSHEPIIDDEFNVKMVNINTPLHWGQKYEPLTVMIYENKYDTKVEDFGCIQHSRYKFIGASPDGIIVNKNSDRFGRMLEIKNVVSREITGIPKNEYWVQMQLQMEVCNLDSCDFLETKFIEYSDWSSYQNDYFEIIDDDENIDDDYSENENENEIDSTITSDGKQKGEIIYFHTKEGTPFYVYKPLNLINYSTIQNWEEDMISKYEYEPYNYLFIKIIYWKLDVFSCVLVERNKEWFTNNVQQLENIWNIIETERISGYEHRAPVKRIKKQLIEPEQVSKCYLFNKIIKVDTV